MRASPLATFNLAQEPAWPLTVTSINERVVLQSGWDDRWVAATQRQCMRQLARPDPHGARFGSDNLAPCPCWGAGCQMVALNFQTTDLPMQLNAALFRLGGGTGYVLKPAELRASALAERLDEAPEGTSIPEEPLSARGLASCSGLVPVPAEGSALAQEEALARAWPPRREQLHHFALELISLHQLPTRNEWCAASLTVPCCHIA